MSLCLPPNNTHCNQPSDKGAISLLKHGEKYVMHSC